MSESGRYLLGLDAGNTVIKAALFDLDGRQLATRAMDGASTTSAAGFVERDMEELWRNAATVVRGCLSEAGARPEEVAAIGCAGHGNGLYLLDRDGAPLLAVQSLDTRAAGLAAELCEDGNGDRLHDLCLQKPWPSQTATLLAWVKRWRPELYARVGTVLLCKDFVNFRLTGRRCSEISDMSGAGFLRMPEAVYDDALLSAYGLDDAQALLPDLAAPTEIVGRVTAEAARHLGLAEGTPVAGGLFDVVASALGSGAVADGQASIIAGTWSINQVIASRAARDPGVFMVSAFGPRKFVAIDASATSAANLEWYVRELVERGGHHDDPFGWCNRLVAGVEAAIDDPVFHPFLYGSGQGAEMRAGFYGVAGWHGEAHLLRALFEGVAFEHRRHVDALRRAGIGFDRAILSGGGSRSPVWPQLFADILGVEVAVAECQETGALGAAIAAGIGAGLFESYEDAVERMTRTKARFAPEPAASSLLEARYDLFLSLTEALRPFWRRVAELKDARP